MNNIVLLIILIVSIIINLVAFGFIGFVLLKTKQEAIKASKLKNKQGNIQTEQEKIAQATPDGEIIKNINQINKNIEKQIEQVKVNYKQNQSEIKDLVKKIMPKISEIKNLQSNLHKPKPFQNNEVAVNYLLDMVFKNKQNYDLSFQTSIDKKTPLVAVFDSKKKNYIFIDSQINTKIYQEWAQSDQIIKKEKWEQFEIHLKKKLQELKNKYNKTQEHIMSQILYIPSDQMFLDIMNDKNIIKTAQDLKIFVLGPSNLQVFLYNINYLFNQN